jgi:P pilus assembly chaperone PapD
MHLFKTLSWLRRSVLLGLVLLVPVSAMAELMLFPTRVTLEANQRAAQVELINQGQTPASYRISLVNRRMSDTGEIVSIETPQPGEQFANEMLRFSPRQVTLQPGQSQTVRISVRKPAGLAAGEYRSHLQFERLPDAEGQANLEQAMKPDSGQMSVQITALLGASIPVIVRHGDNAASVTLDKLALEHPAPAAGRTEAPPPLLTFQLNRSGNRSVYGNLTASYTPAGGQPLEVGKVVGVAVYVPNTLRIAKLPLRLPEGVALQGGVISLRYDLRPEEGGNNLAQATLVLP